MHEFSPHVLLLNFSAIKRVVKFWGPKSMKFGVGVGGTHENCSGQKKTSTDSYKSSHSLPAEKKKRLEFFVPRVSPPFFWGKETFCRLRHCSDELFKFFRAKQRVFFGKRKKPEGKPKYQTRAEKEHCVSKEMHFLKKPW